MSNSNDISLYRRHGPVRECIYCRSTAQPLTSEHIIPYSLGGVIELTSASCESCARETTRIEAYMARTLWGNARMRANFPTRRRNDRPKSIALYVNGSRQIDVPIASYPAIAPMIWLPEPGILVERRADETLDMKVRAFLAQGATTSDLGVQSFESEVALDYIKYVRFLAKIAHGFAVLYLGVDGFEHTLPQLILMNTDARFFDYVGGDIALHPPGDPPSDARHTMYPSSVSAPDGTKWICLNLRLFDGWSYASPQEGAYGTPHYKILAGKHNAVTEGRLKSLIFYPEAM